jgi:hypothetical protein
MPIALKYLPLPLDGGEFGWGWEACVFPPSRPSPARGEGVCTSPSPRIARHAGAASTPPAHYPTITDVVKMGWPRCIVFA